MMAEKDNGGPAFPTEPNTQPGFYVHHGMSLRDWFAGQALAGVIASHVHPNSSGVPNDDRAAAWSYEFADAMLRARQGGS